MRVMRLVNMQLVKWMRGPHTPGRVGGRSRYGSELRTVLSLLLALGTLGLSTGASNVAVRYNALSHQMMCTCGCVQLLGECSHMGCPDSPGMLSHLNTDLSSGMSDHAVLVDFEQQYGPTALASPRFTRFNQAAWVVPPAILILGMLGAWILLRRWREGGLAAVAAQAARRPTAEQSAALARVRSETGMGSEFGEQNDADTTPRGKSPGGGSR
jgi:cytochrome c-type biogenesis protein CcmH/NrfF